MNTLRHLYHFPLCPFSRKVRIALKEKGLAFELITEYFWERREEFLRANPAGDVPVFIEQKNVVLSDHTAICEYLHEYYQEHNLLGKTIAQRAEVRRLTGWFDRKFNHEVTQYLLHEKLFKRYREKISEPNSQIIRAGKTNLRAHLHYITYLIKERKWLAGELFSQADIAAASHLSVLDYFGDVPWEDYPVVKEWYAIMKSRPSMRPLLHDRIPGLIPPHHYAHLDF